MYDSTYMWVNICKHEIVYKMWNITLRIVIGESLKKTDFAAIYNSNSANELILQTTCI